MKNFRTIALWISIFVCGLLIGHFFTEKHLSIWYIMTYNDQNSKNFYFNQAGLGNEVEKLIEDTLPKLLTNGRYRIAVRNDVPKPFYTPLIYNTEDQMRSIIKNVYLVKSKIIYANKSGIIKLSHHETKQFYPRDFPLLVNRYIVERYGAYNNYGVKKYIFSNGKGFIDSHSGSYYQYQNGKWRMMASNFMIKKVSYSSIREIVEK